MQSNDIENVIYYKLFPLGPLHFHVKVLTGQIDPLGNTLW